MAVSLRARDSPFGFAQGRLGRLSPHEFFGFCETQIWLIYAAGRGVIQEGRECFNSQIMEERTYGETWNATGLSLCERGRGYSRLEVVWSHRREVGKD